MTFFSNILMLSVAATFLLSLLQNLGRKNVTLICFYLLQSVAVAFSLVSLAILQNERGLIYAAFLTLAVKAIMAPLFLIRLVRRFSAHFSAASYLSVPLTLISLATFTGLSYALSPKLGSTNTEIPLLLAAIFCAFFLMINRRGALAVIVGVLALENSIVLLSAVLGATQTFALEFTITFDIALWTLIAAAFLRMMHRQFGVADTDSRLLTHLTED